MSVTSPPPKPKSRRLLIWLPIITSLAIGIYFFSTRLPSYANITQIWASSGVEYANTDSLAAYRGIDGTVFVAATSKWEKRIDLFDARSGKFVHSLTAVGLVRPNGIAVARLPGPIVIKSTPNGPKLTDVERRKNAALTATQQLLMVVDRDAPGVFVFDVATEELITRFGDDLKNPYGIATTIQDRALMVYVTDVGRAANEVVTRYRITTIPLSLGSSSQDEPPSLQIEQMGTFGDSAAGRIGKPESIVIDETRGRVLLCDEDRNARNVKVYDCDGNFTGTTFGDGIVRGDPEGIVIVGDSKGDFILVTDQTRRLTAWHAFDASDYQHLVSLTGDPRIANTDGICIFQGAIDGFRSGGLFAVNDDADVHAFDLADVRKLVRDARKATLP